MDKPRDWPTASQPERDQLPESSVRPTQSSQVNGGVQPTGRHQITHAQEAALLEMFGIQVRRPGVSQTSEREQTAQVRHGTAIK